MKCPRENPFRLRPKEIKVRRILVAGACVLESWGKTLVPKDLAASSSWALISSLQG